MSNKKYLKAIFLGMILGIFLPMVTDASQTSNLPSGWSSEAHNSLISKVHEIRGFLFSTPVIVAAMFAFAMATYHAFREGSITPLLSVMGIVIVANLVPFILDIFHPTNAHGMTLDCLKTLTVSLVNQ